MRERWTVRWFRRRALVYHALVLVLAPTCLYAGWWQVKRAESGNTLSYLYAFEWPIFAVIAVIGWWQLIHENPADVDARKVERARRAATTGPFVPLPPDADTGFTPSLGSGPLGSAPAGIRPGRGPLERLGPVELDGELRPSDPGALELVARGQVVVDARTGRAEAAEPGSGEGAVHALSSYNAYLARLSAGGGRKSWRNPHGAPARPPTDGGGGRQESQPPQGSGDRPD